MEQYCVLYNPNAGNGHGREQAETLRERYPAESLQFCDMTAISSYEEFLGSLSADTRLVLTGGDGTLNRFINDTKHLDIEQDVYYYAAGSGNDFLRDLHKPKEGDPFCINEQLKDLPEVDVNGRQMLFINGVGYGVDGYACAEGDKRRTDPTQKINYAKYALKGLLFAYRPTNAVVTVDGVTREYRHVWLAPTMWGEYCGGGIRLAPGQVRNNEENTVSVMVMHSRWRLLTWMIFPSIFKGNHVKHDKVVEVFRGHRVEVSFDRPTAVQVDGECVRDVLTYRVRSATAIQEDRSSEAATVG